MKEKLRFSFVLVLLALMFVQVAFASNCEFTFSANGKTYYAIHHATDGYYECLNREPDTSPNFNDPSPEHLAYSLAFDDAKDQHHAACPYVNGRDLGDESVPMTLLCGGMALAAVSAILVHRKRKSI